MRISTVVFQEYIQNVVIDFLTEKIAEKVYATQAEICIGVTNIEKLFLFSSDVINEFHKKVQEGSLSVV